MDCCKLRLIKSREFVRRGWPDAEQFLQQNDASSQKPFLTSFLASPCFAFPNSILPCLLQSSLCVTLEFQAGDTRGNAVAAGKWVQANGFRSLQLVTANYHMPRAKAIFTRKLSNIVLSYWPVSPDDLDLDIWWKTPPIIRLLAREYAKYLTEPMAHLILTSIND